MFEVPKILSAGEPVSSNQGKVRCLLVKHPFGVAPDHGLGHCDNTVGSDRIPTPKTEALRFSQLLQLCIHIDIDTPFG